MCIQNMVFSLFGLLLHISCKNDFFIEGFFSDGKMLYVKCLGQLGFQIHK